MDAPGPASLNRLVALATLALALGACTEEPTQPVLSPPALEASLSAVGTPNQIVSGTTWNLRVSGELAVWEAQDAESHHNVYGCRLNASRTACLDVPSEPLAEDVIANGSSRRWDFGDGHLLWSSYPDPNALIGCELTGTPLDCATDPVVVGGYAYEVAVGGGHAAWAENGSSTLHVCDLSGGISGCVSTARTVQTGAVAGIPIAVGDRILVWSEITTYPAHKLRGCFLSNGLAGCVPKDLPASESHGNLSTDGDLVGWAGPDPTSPEVALNVCRWSDTEACVPERIAEANVGLVGEHEIVWRGRYTADFYGCSVGADLAACDTSSHLLVDWPEADLGVLGHLGDGLVGWASVSGAYLLALDRDNAPPVANAGGGETGEIVTPTGIVTLDGSGSSDPDNDPITCVWDFVADDGVVRLADECVKDGVEFPTADGRYLARLTVSDGELESEDYVTVVVDGSLASPEVTVSHDRLVFQDIDVGDTETLPLTISNSGGGTLTGTATLQDARDFQIDPEEADFSIPDGEEHTLHVVFSPTEEQEPFATTLVIDTNAEGSPTTVDLDGESVCSSLAWYSWGTRSQCRLIADLRSSRYFNVAREDVSNLQLLRLLEDEHIEDGFRSLVEYVNYGYQIFDWARDGIEPPGQKPLGSASYSWDDVWKSMVGATPHLLEAAGIYLIKTAPIAGTALNSAGGALGLILQGHQIMKAGLDVSFVRNRRTAFLDYFASRNISGVPVKEALEAFVSVGGYLDILRDKYGECAPQVLEVANGAYLMVGYNTNEIEGGSEGLRRLVGEEIAAMAHSREKRKGIGDEYETDVSCEPWWR